MCSPTRRRRCATPRAARSPAKPKLRDRRITEKAGSAMSTPSTPPPKYGSEPTISMPVTAEEPSWGPAQQEDQTPKRSKKHLIGYPVTALVALLVGTAAGGGDGSASPTAAAPRVVVTQSAATPPVALTVTQTVQATVTV